VDLNQNGRLQVKISKVRISNFKSLADTDEISLGQVNVLVGRNNHGKSAFIRAVNLMQRGATIDVNDIRLGEKKATVAITLAGADIAGDIHRYFGHQTDQEYATLTATLQRQMNDTFNFSASFTPTGGTTWGGPPLANEEPQNFIYTYLSKRKVTTFDQVVDLGRTLAVPSNLQYLVSKVARLANPHYMHFEAYDKLCQAVLGFRVSTHASPAGQQAGIPVGAYGYIPIESMGEGVSSQLGLITDLVMADGNLFLIEEMENDIHPEGLKALLNVIVEKSSANQFIVTTHSNIVLRYMGAAPDSKIFEFESEYRPNVVPTSTVRDVPATAEARIAALRRLGYELSDFDLWDGWLILEESSAEIIIRYLIPWFAPGLSRVRTVAAGGVSKVEPTFEDFRRLFLFAHLEPQYQGRAWVIVDGDSDGRKIVAGLREKYKAWGHEHFDIWDQPDFELYYPRPFHAQVAAALAKHHGEKRPAKKQLLDDVKAWCDMNPKEARATFEESAAEVIGKLRTIEQALFGRSSASDTQSGTSAA
jgi:hypothetical protein